MSPLSYFLLSPLYTFPSYHTSSIPSLSLPFPLLGKGEGKVRVRYPHIPSSPPLHLHSWVRVRHVTDLQGPPSERTPEEKLWDFKTRAQQYARDRRSCDDTRISYLEFLETEAEDDLALARMIAG
jgi:hypothetical protein